MATSSEQMQILKMLEAGQISADEAAKLLAALDAPRDTDVDDSVRAKWFRMRITDTETGRTKVNVNVPISLVNLGLSIGSRLTPDAKRPRVDEVITAIQSGVEGKIVDVDNEETGERVEVFVE